MADNMTLYNALRTAPPEALKTITGGRLNGFTDISPMWRIKALTEQFGPCGVGWYIKDVKCWTEAGAGETAAFVELALVVKIGGEWSAPIYGIGGSRLVASEKSGARLDDECYKKAYTDAIGTACKALGMAADVYWDKDATKYTRREYDNVSEKDTPNTSKADRLNELKARYKVDNATLQNVQAELVERGVIKDKPSAKMTDDEFSLTLACIEDRLKGKGYKP